MAIRSKEMSQPLSIMPDVGVEPTVALSQSRSMRKFLVVFSLLPILPGCMEVQLRDRAATLATTTSDLLYQQVLNNLARQVTSPASLPSLDVPALGTAQIQRAVAVTYQPGWDFITSGAYAGRYLFDKQQAILNGQQTNQDAWQLAPLNNPDRLYLMQCAYHRVIGTEDPLGASVLNDYYIKRNQALTKGAGPKGPTHTGYPEPTPKKTPNPAQPPKNGSLNLSVPTAKFGPIVQVGGKDSGDSKTGATGPLPLNIPYEAFLAQGWFGVGKRRDVPKDACYVAHHCHTYVWVTSDHLDDLSRFTLAILDIATPFSIDTSTGQAVRQTNPFGVLPVPPPAIGH